MLSRIGAYLVTLAVFAGIEIPFLPIMFLIGVPLKRARWLAPFVTCLLAVVKIATAALLATWLIQKFGQAPSGLMLLIPGYAMFHNNLRQLRSVKAGRSNVKSIVEQKGESYDQESDLRMKWAYLVGDLVGWVVGASLVLRSTSKFF